MDADPKLDFSRLAPEDSDVFPTAKSGSAMLTTIVILPTSYWLAVLEDARVLISLCLGSV